MIACCNKCTHSIETRGMSGAKQLSVRFMSRCYPVVLLMTHFQFPSLHTRTSFYRERIYQATRSYSVVVNPPFHGDSFKIELRCYLEVNGWM